MRRARLVVEETAQSETRTPRAVNGGGQRDTVHPDFTEIRQRCVDNLALATDTFELFLIRCYVVRLDGQVLFAIGVIADLDPYVLSS